MKAIKLLVTAAALLAVVVFGAVRAQDDGAELGETWWDTPALWSELEIELAPRAAWCEGLEIAEADYEAAFVAGQTDAESLEEYCLQIKAAFYLRALGSCRNCLERSITGPAETESTACQCVCDLYSDEMCQRCMANPSDPELLRLPGICECIVRQ